MQAEEFLPIQSLDIEGESRINFNLYVNLPLNNKYILYRRAGETIESAKLEKFSEGNVSNFFIEKKDYQEFVKYVAQRINTLIGAQDSVESRQLMAATARSILSSTINQTDSSITNALMANLKDITGIIIEKTLENSHFGAKKLYKRLAELAERGSDFQKHPVNVASLSILITLGIGYSREKILNDVAMAALLHDVGLSRLQPKLANHSHNILKLSIPERLQIYQHPQMAIEILEEKKIPVSELTKTLILQHHEEFNGSGYPAGLRGYTINELAQILRVADDLDQLFTQMQTNPGNLRLRTVELLQRLAEQKVIEPLLLSRIRQVLI